MQQKIESTTIPLIRTDFARFVAGGKNSTSNEAEFRVFWQWPLLDDP